MSLLNPRALKMGVSIVLRGLSKKGHTIYVGSPKQIGMQIIRDCWNGKYFQASAGHFNQFWIRDFALHVPALLKLGFETEVKKTLTYALDQYAKSRRVATTIINDAAVDVPTFAPDSLAYLLLSINEGGASDLVEKYKVFLEAEIERFKKVVIDHKTGLVKRRKYFASMQDTIKRDSSCYDNVMVALVEGGARKLRLKCSFVFPYERFLKYYWTGEYFLDDQSGQKYIGSDANLYPVWAGIVPDQNINQRAIDRIAKEELDQPFPLRFTQSRSKLRGIFTLLLTPNYQGSTHWPLSGGIYLQLIKKHNPALYAKHMDTYAQLITKHKNYFEIYESDGRPYRTLFYKADEGMLWVANFLAGL